MSQPVSWILALPKADGQATNDAGFSDDGIRIVFLGPPTAGKGTQATSLAEKYSASHLSTGRVRA
jgi:hypothetical protein